MLSGFFFFYTFFNLQFERGAFFAFVFFIPLMMDGLEKARSKIWDFVLGRPDSHPGKESGLLMKVIGS